MSGGCGSSLFGSGSQYIKVSGGDFIAIEGANVLDRLGVSDLRMPYKQILKSRIILKAGQINYLLNHLGLGDNATFILIKATYNQKSVIEEDNYINWNFYDDFTNIYSMAQMMVLTGNSTNRIKQLYLTNPNSKYPVILDVMVGVIDDEFSFFSDSNQAGTSFTGLEYTDIQSHIVGQSIVINDKGTPVRPLIYMDISNIESIEKSGNILIVDNSFGTIFLQFLTEFDTYQAYSILNYIIENPNVDISTLTPDLSDPVLTFFSNVGATSSGDFIAFNGSTIGVPYDTTSGFTFSTTISLNDFGSHSIIDKDLLIDLLIDNVFDNREGTMSLISSNLILNDDSGEVDNISATGSYILTFDLSDIAHNLLDGVHVDITIV